MVLIHSYSGVMLLLLCLDSGSSSLGLSLIQVVIVGAVVGGLPG